MGKVWVLHTETKGTGANMVPLERVVSKGSSAPEPVFVRRKPRPRPEEAPKPKPPRRFRVVDLMSREALVDDGSARETADVLKGVRSIVDVNLYVWQDEQQRWRMLTLDEKRDIWELAHR
jgi:hypothetical protein